MSEWALDTTVARYVPAADRAVCALPSLDGQRVAVLLAESVPTAPLRAIALPLIRGAERVIVRPARRQRAFATLVAEGLSRQAGLPVELFPADEPGEFLRFVMAGGIDTVIAYGADETLRALRAELPRGVRFEGRGHGFGVAVVLREAVVDTNRDSEHHGPHPSDGASSVHAIGNDVAAYDQHGCLSPRVVLVEGTDDDAVRVAECIVERLAFLSRHCPRGPLDLGLAAAIVQWQGAMAARAAYFWRGVDHSVAVLCDSGLASTPGGRNIAVLPCGSLRRIRELLAPVASYLTCIGLAGPASRWNELTLPPGACPRLVAAGTMQDPPLDGYEDPRPLVMG